MKWPCWFGHAYESRILPGEPKQIAPGVWVPQIKLLQFCPRCRRKYDGQYTGEITNDRLSSEDERQLLSNPATGGSIQKGT